MLYISRRIVLCVCLCCSVASQAINFHIPSYIFARCIAERTRSLRGSLTTSLSKAAHCKALTYIQTHPKKVGVYALAATAALSVCICGLRAMNRHSSEGTRVSLAQRIRNFVRRIGGFMHRESSQQAHELEQRLTQECDQIHALEERNATLAREKDGLERRRIELEQQVEQQQNAYAFLLKTFQDADKGLTESDKLISELKSKLDDYSRRLELSDEATQTEHSDASGLVVSAVPAAPSAMPLPPSCIDLGERRVNAELLSEIAMQGRAEVTGVLEQTRRVLELAQQRNKVDVTTTSGFGPAVGEALGTSYHPASE